MSSAIPCSLSLISRIHSFLGLEAYCLIEILQHTGLLDFHRRTCAPSSRRCMLSRLRFNKHSLLLSSYLFRIARIENPSCSTCGHSSQDTSHLILHCTATDSLRHSLFGDSLSLYDLWSRLLRVARLLGLRGLPPCPIPGMGSGNNNNNNRTNNICELVNLRRMTLYCGP